MSLRIVIASGIFPPDIGGPATHAADLAAELTDRGHEVFVLSLTDECRSVRRPDQLRHPRRWPWPLRTAAASYWLIAHRQEYDAVYATGLDPAAVGGARLAGRPVVLKIVGDPAWERGKRRGLTGVDFTEFQEADSSGRSIRAMRFARNWSAGAATAVVTPSDYLAGVVRRWTGQRADISVIRNGVRGQGDLAPTAVASRPDGTLRLVYVGRLVPHKHVDVLVQAVERTERVTLDIVGDGPELERLQSIAQGEGVGGRIRFRGSLPHAEVMAHLRAADALVSASSYEGLPHVLIEALTCGTPIVSTPAGGVVEVVVDGVNGVLVDGPDLVAAFEGALGRLRDDPDLLSGLADGAIRAGEEWRFDRCADQVEALLRRVAVPRPRAVYVGSTVVPNPPGPELTTKFSVHARHLRQVSVNIGPPGIRTVAGVRVVCFPRFASGPLGSFVFYFLGPVVAVGVAVGGRPCAIVCQSPYEGLGVMLISTLLPRSLRPPVQVELHGDWRTASRLYGSPARRVLAPLFDRACEWTLRRADQVRAVSHVLEDLARDTGYRGPIDRYITFSDYPQFFERPPVPLPEDPVALFIGVLERYKAVDVLLDAWPDVIAALPGARLIMVGTGSMRAELRSRVRADGLTNVTFLEPVSRAELSWLLDDSTCLVLPSRSEGLPRVVMEAMGRGRAVVASDVGGMRELVQDGLSGRVIAVEDVMALAKAMVEVLGDRATAAGMGDEARARADARGPVAEYEAGIARLARWIETS